MIKHVDSTAWSNLTVGYIQLIEWVSVNYIEPEQSGRYLVADGCGHTRDVNFALDDFRSIVFGKRRAIPNIMIHWHESGEELSAGELISIINRGHVWYYTGIQDDIEGCPETFLIAIMTTEDFEFWIDANDIFHGPTELDRHHSPTHTVAHSTSVLRHNDEKVIHHITTVNPIKSTSKERN